MNNKFLPKRIKIFWNDTGSDIESIFFNICLSGIIYLKRLYFGLKPEYNATIK